MGQVYEQISMEERCRISQMRQAGTSIRQIAATLDRSPSSISRELKRNLTPSLNYQANYAHQVSRSRRWKGSKLLRDLELQEKVLQYLQLGWSPEQVSGRLSQQSGKPILSYESIYRFIYSQIARSKDYSWRYFLPRSKSKRGFRGRKGGPSSQTIPHRVSIDLRPPHRRQDPGHWEADLMSFSSYQQHLLVALDRSSRLIFLFNQPRKTASQVTHQLQSLFQALPQKLRQTITFDNGTEFAAHHQLHPIQTFFCDPYSPWQKGSIENAIGRLRRVLPRRTNLENLSPQSIAACALAYNHTPRKCLGFKTPAEVFLNHLLHFDCESTSPPPRGRQ